MGHWSWGCFSLISCYLELTSLLTMPPPLTLSTLPTLLPHALWIHVILFFLTSLSHSLLFWLHSPSNLQCLDSSLCSMTFLYPSKPQVILPLQLTMYLGHLFFQCCIIVFPWGHISPCRDLSS